MLDLQMVVVFLCLFWLTVTIIYTRHSNSIIVKSNSGSSNYSPHPRKKLPEFIFTCTKCTCVISVHIEEIVHSSINKYMMYMKFLGKKSISTALHDNINIRCCLCTITHWTFFSFRTTFMVFMPDNHFYQPVWNEPVWRTVIAHVNLFFLHNHEPVV